MNHTTLITTASKDYELIDSGDGEKFERFGGVTFARPDPQALWPKAVPDRWRDADARYVRTGPKSGEWKTRRALPERWTITMDDLRLIVRPTTFKHVGVFPEQAPNWQWLRACVRDQNPPRTVLNLFGYTGAASIACAQAGAQVTHVDSSKVAVTWARENLGESGLANAPVRWIVDDAFAFVKKELRRGKTYDGILMDPPTFGHGIKKGELWKIEKQFTDLVADCVRLLSSKPTFFLINGYAAGYSSIAYANNLLSLVDRFGGTIEHGELTIEESGAHRLLPAGIVARWRA